MMCFYEAGYTLVSLEVTLCPLMTILVLIPCLVVHTATCDVQCNILPLGILSQERVKLVGPCDAYLVSLRK